MNSKYGMVKIFWGLGWLRDIPIRRRLLLSFSGGLVGLLTIITLLWVKTSQYHIQREMDDHIHLVQVIAYHVDDHLERHGRGLLQTAAMIDISDDDPQPERRALQELYRVGQYPQGVFLLDRRGRVIWTEPYQEQKIGLDLAASLPLVSHTLDGHGLHISDLTPWADETPISILFLTPLFNQDGIVSGVLGGVLDPRVPTFGAAISLLPLPVEGEVELFDSNGLIVSHSDPGHIFEPTEHYPALQALVKTGEAGSAVATILEDGQEEKQAIVYAPLANADWGVEIALPYKNVFAPVQALQTSLVTTIALVLLFVLAAAGVVNQTIVVPLQTLEGTARRLAAGELDTPILSPGRDEISALGRAFETMRGELVSWGRYLEEKVTARTQRLTLLHRLGKKLNASLDLDELLENIRDEIASALPVEAFYIALFDPRTQLLDYRIRCDRGTSYPPEKHPLGEGLTGWVITNKTPLLIRDLAEESENLPAALLWGSGDATRSGLSVPLLRDQAVIGVISVQSYAPNAFDEDDLEFLQIIAGDVTVAVESTRLSEQTARRARQLALVNEIGREMTRLVDAQTLLRETSRQIVERLGYTAAGVYVFRGDSLTLIAEYSHLKGWAPLGVEAVPMGQGVAGYVAQSLQPLLVPDVTVEDRFVPYEGLVDIRAELAVPVISNFHLAGVLDVCSQELGGLDETDQQMLEAIAGQLAKTLSNGNLYQQVQQQASRAEALNQIISQAASVLEARDLPKLLEIALERMLDALSLEIGAIWVPPHNANAICAGIKKT